MDFDRSASQIHNREKRTHRAKVQALLVLLSVAFILTSCKQTPGEPARTFRVAGQVLDSANGLFVAGIVVQLGPLVDTSDATDNFVFTSVPEGQYTITMLSPGYARLDSLITVDSDKMLSIYVHKPAPQELVVPQIVGTTWMYEYNTVLVNAPSGISISTDGIHTWQMISSDV